MLLMLLAGIAGPAAADPAATAEAWRTEKCLRYTRAWNHMAAGDGLSGIGPEFIAAHDAFLAAGCSGPREVCPQNRAERALADTLALMAVAEGTAGSFLPFRCPAG